MENWKKPKALSKEDSEIRELYAKADGVMIGVANDLGERRFESLKGLLRLMMRLPRESLFTQLLTFADWPDTQSLLSADHWRQCGRTIKDGSRPVPRLLQRCNEHTHSFPGYFGEEIHIYEMFSNDQTEPNKEPHTVSTEAEALWTWNALTWIVQTRKGLSPSFVFPKGFWFWSRVARMAPARMDKAMVHTLLRPVVADWMKSASTWRRTKGISVEAAAVEWVVLDSCGFADEDVESRLKRFFFSRSQLAAALFTIGEVLGKLDHEVEQASWDFPG